MIMNLDFYKKIPQKECRECGAHFEEQAESYIYECERCFGLKEE